MEYLVLKGFQVDGYAALEVGEVALLPYEADRVEWLVEQGYLAPVAAEEGERAGTSPAPTDAGPAAESHPHFVGQGEPPPDTWEALWAQGRAESPPEEM